MMSASHAPDGYIIERVSGGTLVAREASLAAARGMVERAGSLSDFAASHGTELAASGRGAAHRVAAPDGDWVVRHYRRGGSVARVLGDRYLRMGRPRPLAELRASEAARRKGVRTPRIEAAYIRSTGAVYRADLATGYVPDSCDLATFAFGGPADLPAPLAVWRAAGRLLKEAFAAGVVHADLNLGNILIQIGGDSPVAHLIDLDRARVFDAVSAAQRARMLARFHRSRTRLEARSGRLATEAELTAFEQAVSA